MSWLIKLGHIATDNALYRSCVQHRQALALRKYDGRPYGYEHAIQQRFWEWWLDRFDMVTWHCSTIYAYVGLRREDLRSLCAMAHYLGAARQMKDRHDDEERIDRHRPLR